MRRHLRYTRFSVRSLALIPAAIAALLGGCQSPPDWYAPPVQRTPIEQPRFPRSARVVEMGDPAADALLVRDIRGSEGAWRWTGRRPAVRIYVSKPEGLEFVADFALSDATFRDTGPLLIRFQVNGRELAAERYEQAGQKQFRKRVPSGWLRAGEEAEVGLELDKVWVSKSDGAELGVILSRLGLAPKE